MAFRCFLLLFLPLSLFGQDIAPEGSEIDFVFLERNVDGSIDDMRSASQIDLQDFTQSEIRGSVAVNTLDTDNFIRDGHLMWEKYFNEDDYPRISFYSTTIERKKDNTYLIEGMLSMKGTTSPITITASLMEDSISAETTTNITNWGIQIEDEISKNKVKVNFEWVMN